MKIIPLSEGAFTVDKSKQMVPFNAGEDALSERNRGSLLVGITSFVVITSNDIILLDAGVGTVENNQYKIVNILRENKISTSDVTKVLMSHLHTDHVGAMSYLGKDGNRHMTFPNATYYIQEKELEYALSGESRSYKKDELSYLQDHPSVQLINGDGSIDDYIYYNITAAHSKYHQVFWIEEDNEMIFFGADDAPQLVQMKSRFVAKYDYDGKKCMELRQQWWETGHTNKWTFLFYHDIHTPVYKAE